MGVATPTDAPIAGPMDGDRAAKDVAVAADVVDAEASAREVPSGSASTPKANRSIPLRKMAQPSMERLTHSAVKHVQSAHREAIAPTAVIVLPGAERSAMRRLSVKMPVVKFARKAHQQMERKTPADRKIGRDAKAEAVVVATGAAVNVRLVKTTTHPLRLAKASKFPWDLPTPK